MIASYKSVVLFRDSPALFEAQKEFESISFIKFFHTSNPDEVAQIAAQSDQTIIFLYNPKNAAVFADVRTARTKFYYYDQIGIAPNETVEELSAMGIATLKQSKTEEIVAKIALIFLGKVTLRKSENFTPFAKEPEAPRSYFTHFEYRNHQWNLVVSSHEKDPEIESRFSLSWSLYIRRVLERAGELRSQEEDPHFSIHYHSIVYPHRNSEVLKLSIIHIRKDPVSFDTLRSKALIFLKGLDK